MLFFGVVGTCHFAPETGPSLQVSALGLSYSSAGSTISHAPPRPGTQLHSNRRASQVGKVESRGIPVEVEAVWVEYRIRWTMLDLNSLADLMSTYYRFI